ncbi:MAG: hypothetical protein KDA85_14225, partial [Planctomycetaceae bacterium]|nr:hypothetical protein [Planctomycetaceae bacterium]
DITDVVATDNTLAGSYEVNITTAAEKATVSSAETGISGADTLSRDETLTITGSNGSATVLLEAGLDQDGIIDAINAVTDDTGVVAEVDPADSTKIRFSSLEFGSAESITVVSDTASSGITAPDVTGVSGGVLGADETLTITGEGGTANVNVLEDDDLATVVSKINTEKGNTGVEAYLDPDDNTKIKFKSLTDGPTSSISVVSDTAVQEYAAVVTAGTTFTTLTADEVVTVNGTDIQLLTGDDLATVINKINNEQWTTGVTVADNGSGILEFTSKSKGTDVSLSVVSDTNAGDTGISDTTLTASGKASSGIGTTALTSEGSYSSGVGTTDLTDTGVDIAGTIDGEAATGEGNVLTATDGDATDLTLTFGESTADSVLTELGDLGTVDVVDNSLVFQIGANQNQTARISIQDVNADQLGVDVDGNQFANLSEIDVTTADGAQDAIAVIDSAINDITTLRGTLGAFQANTLESTANNLRSTLENTVNAESVIRDTDFASEIAAFTKNQVLVQAGTSVLSNANQIPQLVLSLLR